MLQTRAHTPVTHIESDATWTVAGEIVQNHRVTRLTLRWHMHLHDVLLQGVRPEQGARRCIEDDPDDVRSVLLYTIYRKFKLHNSYVYNYDAHTRVPHIMTAFHGIPLLTCAHASRFFYMYKHERFSRRERNACGELLLTHVMTFSIALCARGDATGRTSTWNIGHRWRRMRGEIHARSFAWSPRMRNSLHLRLFVNENRFNWMVERAPATDAADYVGILAHYQNCLIKQTCFVDNVNEDRKNRTVFCSCISRKRADVPLYTI